MAAMQGYPLDAWLAADAGHGAPVLSYPSPSVETRAYTEVTSDGPVFAFTGCGGGSSSEITIHHTHASGYAHSLPTQPAADADQFSWAPQYGAAAMCYTSPTYASSARAIADSGAGPLATAIAVPVQQSRFGTPGQEDVQAHVFATPGPDSQALAYNNPPPSGARSGGMQSFGSPVPSTLFGSQGQISYVQAGNDLYSPGGFAGGMMLEIEQPPLMQTGQVSDLFDVIDVNRDGVITRSEFSKMVNVVIPGLQVAKQLR
eukprot:NODE_10240_length_1367_cov_2.158871.p1 GENE.NODE_10240_length_1367_cov_2.158871~~NODE_10240_length_1367_cov_2.158871.p1  ORF type:complete len:268 (+),score=61.81 NODE_10240_length_1367_cov_2.158871:28-804(+)